MSKKSFEVDVDDPSDLKRLISILQKRRKYTLRGLGYHEVYFNGNAYHLDLLMPAFNTMYDFGTLAESSTNTKKNYYVYFHCNPLKPLDTKAIRTDIKFVFLASKFPNLKFQPFYVGKGVGDRFEDLNRNDSYRKIRHQLKQFNLDIEPTIVLSNLTEQEALAKESNLIDILGLMCYSKNGILCNLDEGQGHKERRSQYTDPIIQKILKRNGFKIK